MQSTIFSDHLILTINSLGAELCSIKNKSGLEFLWQADKDVWPRHAPVLFPIVGKLKNNQFDYLGKTYALTQHGFARDLEFKLIEQKKDFCIFQLDSSLATKELFPFDFIFKITHAVKENKLTTNYSVINTSSEALFFSLGAHPGFRCPLLPFEQWQDYYLEFESSDYWVTQLANGLRTDAKMPTNFRNKKCQLSTELFDKDALVFENNQIDRISLRSIKSSHAITLECRNWPYFGIWSQPAPNDFICLEPWYGIADSLSASGQLNQKEGIINLGSQKEFKCSFSITFV